MNGSTAASVAPALRDRMLESPGADFVVAEWTDPGVPPGSPPQFLAPQHLHHRDDEAWYVLEGTLHVRLADRDIEVRAGAGVMGPRGVPHTFWNPGPAPARYLLIMSANVARLVAELHRRTNGSPETLRAIFREYDAELLGELS